MADKTMGAQDFLMFQTLLNQAGPRSYANQALYGMFPKTAAAAAGMPMAGYGAIPLSKSALSTGAAGVARMGATRLPLAQGLLQTLGGDPIGGVGTAGGGFLGAKAGAAIGTAIAPGIGTLAGGLIGGLAGGSAGQSLTRGLAGIDVNNPLTGPDLSIAGIPLSQYAKTKKSLERATELEKKRYQELAPLYEKARNQQMARDMIGSQMGLAQTMLGSVYGR
jgi:hypothetical protein